MDQFSSNCGASIVFESPKDNSWKPNISTRIIRRTHWLHLQQNYVRKSPQILGCERTWLHCQHHRISSYVCRRDSRKQKQLQTYPMRPQNPKIIMNTPKDRPRPLQKLGEQVWEQTEKLRKVFTGSKLQVECKNVYAVLTQHTVV